MRFRAAGPSPNPRRLFVWRQARIAITFEPLAESSTVLQYMAQSSIKQVRLSNISPRRYVTPPGRLLTAVLLFFIKVFAPADFLNLGS